jgi:DNA-binding NarL/FixJ family response regulator
MSGRLLLVEDDVDARESLTRSLMRCGFVVISAGDVDGGVRLARDEEGLRVIVSDMVLGDQEDGGIQVLREVRKQGTGVPVILITAFASLDNVKQGLNEGAAFLLEKPFRSAELLQVIERVTSEVPDMAHHVERVLEAAGLTEKELAVARLVLKGLTSTEIARLEQNSDKTVRQHITRIYSKCGVSSRPEFFHCVFPW